MSMSKKIEKSTIQTSVYKTEQENNDPKVEALLKQALPELTILFDRFGLSMNELLEFAYSMKVVRRHGWGKVIAVVKNHETCTINATIETQLTKTGEETLPKRQNVI